MRCGGKDSKGFVVEPQREEKRQVLATGFKQWFTKVRARGRDPDHRGQITEPRSSRNMLGFP